MRKNKLNFYETNFLRCIIFNQSWRRFATQSGEHLQDSNSFVELKV